ncbi:PREDICTED: uncharacterized protein LOC106324204 [Brassica oleracea var. oleracea]|uniref:uncharacterized protein LOC106324204 n=1 Tax=Brassica oleracea var. oleracea TaxID=109376 RepID=UPI0006A745F8|nr:PREDICTED: uncharacterized protein LOC106324204 [Brassica oleracea var. oleracea]
MAKSFLRYEVNDGNTARFWTDIWYPRGRLIEVAGEISTQRLGIRREARISETVEMQFYGREGMVIMVPGLWLLKLGTRSDSLRTRPFTQFSQGIPRYAFITWLAIHDRLSTGRRTSSWGQPQCCIFCMEPDETRDHIFFACPYTFMVWLKVTGNLFGLETDPDWDITLSRLLTGSYDRVTFILLRLVFQVSVYLTWRERNERKHNTSNKSVAQLAKLIDKTVRNRITSLKYACNPRL